jgi:hypothetical protein
MEPASSEMSLGNFETIFTCPKCLGKGVIVFGDDTETGREIIDCDCKGIKFGEHNNSPQRSEFK